LLLCATPVVNITDYELQKALFQFVLIMPSGSSKSLRGNEIYNILEYEGQISSDSKTEAKLYSSNSGSSHIDDTALGEVTVSEIDIKVKNENNEDFLWEHMGNYVGQVFCNVSGPQSSAKDVTAIVECFILSFSRDLIQHIVQVMNEYAQQH
jgi:hypothetical protein